VASERFGRRETETLIEAVMQGQSKLVLIVVLVVTLFTIGRMLRPAFARDRAADPETQGRQLLTGDELKLLFVLMDTDKNGKISKQEWMTFMGTVFETLDQKKTGELDPNELAQLRFRKSTFSTGGK
jgi:hypothetical protein